MLKKSKVIALLVVCVMMFVAVEPALAWWGEDTAYGAYKGGTSGGFWGGVLCAIGVGAVVVATGGLAALPAAATAIGGAAATGAVVGGGTGAVLGAGVGALTDKETVDACSDGITKVSETVAVVVVSTTAGPVAGTAVAAGTGLLPSN